MLTQGKHGCGAVLLFLLAILITSNLVQSKLCSYHLKSFYRNKRYPRIESTVETLFDWLSQSTNGSYPREDQDDHSLLDLSNAFMELQTSPHVPNNFATSKFMQSVHNLATYADSNCLSNKSKFPNLSEVRNIVSRLRSQLREDSLSFKTVNDFGFLWCIAHRLGVLGPPVQMPLSSKKQEIADDLEIFFTVVKYDIKLLSLILGVTIPLPSLGFIVSKHSIQDNLKQLQEMTDRLPPLVEELVHSFLLKTINETDGPSHHSLTNPDQLEAFQNQIDSYTSLPITPSNMCKEQGLTALQEVLEEARPHSTIVLVTGLEPGDAHLLLTVTNLAQVKNVRIYLFLGSTLQCSDTDLHIYTSLAAATGGKVVTSLNDFEEMFTFMQSSGIVGPLERANEVESKINDASICKQFTVSLFDDKVLLFLSSNKKEEISIALQSPDRRVLTYSLTLYLHFALNNPVSGDWVVCGSENFELLVKSPQFYDSSVEYLNNNKGRFVMQTETTGCSRHKIVIQSPRHKLIGDKCPLSLQTIQSNGTVHDDIEIHNCGRYLQARFRVAPKHLTYRITGCDKNGNIFEKSLLAPHFEPSSAAIPMRRSWSSLPNERYIAIAEKEHVLVSYVLESHELEEVKVTFNILNKFKQLKILVNPPALTIPPGGKAPVTFRYMVDGLNQNYTRRIRITAKAVTASSEVKLSCPIWEHFKLRKTANLCGCQNEGTCRRTMSNDLTMENHNCLCSASFKGALCEEQQGQIPGTDSPLCINGCDFGTCEEGDVCVCDEGYSGIACDSPICLKPCVNSGTCTQPGICTCVQGYIGETCSAPVCAQPCLNNGTCASPDVCQCDDRYVGSVCEMPVCIMGCVNGRCASPAICACHPGYTGLTCELPICNPKCENGASCIGPNLCECVDGYQGPTCENKKLPECSASCKNGGTCVEKDVCSCNKGYSGMLCETPICNQKCGNGVCSEPDTCTCQAGYEGATCNVPICHDTCVNGQCSSPDTCSCEAGYAGTLCDQALCDSPCVNGECSAPNTCTCDDGYFGPVCSEFVCSNGCENGVCTQPDVCTCDSGFTGLMCESPFCPEMCQNGGTCVSPGECACLPDFTGRNCENAYCAQGCLNGGVCLEGGVCNCGSGATYTGASCEIPICSPACLNGGVCTDNFQCECPESSFTGDICQDRVCSDSFFYFGFVANIPVEKQPNKIVVFSLENEPVEVTVFPPQQSSSSIIANSNISSVIDVAVGSHGHSISDSTPPHPAAGYSLRTYQEKRIKVLLVNENTASIDVIPVFPTSFLTQGPYTFYGISTETFVGEDGAIVPYVKSAILLVGTVDGTTVTMTTRFTHIFIQRLVIADTPFTFTVNEGETVLYSRREDLTGVKFESSHWVAVFSGHQCGNVPSNQPFCDHLVKQLPPTVSWGVRYVVGYFLHRVSGYVLKMVASEPNTDVVVTCFASAGESTSHIIQLTKSGDFDLLDIEQDIDCTVEASNPILLAQFSKGIGSSTEDIGGPCMLTVPHTGQYVSQASFVIVASQLDRFVRSSKYAVNVIVEEQWAQLNLITLNAIPFSELGVSVRWIEFSPAGRFGIFSYPLTSSNTHDTFKIQHANPSASLYVVTYGFANSWAYCYSSLDEAMSCANSPMP